MHQPTSFRLKVDGSNEGAVSNSSRVDSVGYVVLSERDIERIAKAVVKAIDSRDEFAAKAAAPAEEEPLIPVRRNKPSVPTSEY